MQHIRRHMNPANVIALVALVFAISGGAYAADSGSHSDAVVAKKSKTKVLRGPRGPQGPAGKQGPAGPAGPQGPAGANGKDGLPGAEGKEGKGGKQGEPGLEGKAGKDGATGKSVEALAITDPSKCDEQGGVVLEVEESGTQHEICNGSPWAGGGVLPKGATETGTWVLNASPVQANNKGEVNVSLSFPVELKAKLKSTNVYFVEALTAPCMGTVSAPTAPSETLCVYHAGQPESATFAGILTAPGAGEGATRVGAFLAFSSISDGAFAYGTWAVTG